MNNIFRPRYKLIFLALSIIINALFFFPTIAQADDPVISVAGSTSLAYPGDTTTYRVELLNHKDHVLYDGVISMTLPAGFTYVPSSTVVQGEGWPLENREPTITGQTLTWGPYHLPSAGVTAHNPYGIHTLMHDCQPALHLDGAKTLVGNGGYVKQMFYGIDASTTAPSDCAINFVSEAYTRNLIPIIRLQGHFVDGMWQAPDPGANGDYAEIAQAFAQFVDGLPRRDTNPLYIEVWNEPDLWIEWSNNPNATQYARFFVAVSRAIKELGDARIRVINGALTPGNMTFLRQMLSVPGFKDAFDAWSVHCYPYNHPPSYNVHNRTARYGTYTIDCYLYELDVIKQYGRTGVKVIISETGYELGNKLYGFEGYPAINETNRAAYMSSAFANYWQNWPEVIAVTPFQMSDTSGQWGKFDWINPVPPFTPHAQYTSVATLTKPVGQWVPYGYQVTFHAQISSTLSPGVYTSPISGIEREGRTAFEANGATVNVFAPDDLQKIYLPVIHSYFSKTTGPWYLQVDEPPSPGALVPTNFLHVPNLAAVQNADTITSTAIINFSDTPQQLALDSAANVGAVLLTNSLQTFNLDTHQLGATLALTNTPQTILVGTAGQAYVSLADGLALVDLQKADIIKKISGTGRLRGMALDSATARLFVADAEHDRLLILHQNSLQQIAEVPLDDQPDQLIFDPAARHIYISSPAAAKIIAVNADTLRVESSIKITGGPILDIAFDDTNQQLYILGMLGGRYRGITVLETPTLNQIALIAGTENFPLQQATAIAVTPTEQLLISETDGVWQINPTDFTVNKVIATDSPPADNLSVSQSGTIYALITLSEQVRIYTP